MDAVRNPGFRIETRTWLAAETDRAKRLDHYLVDHGLPRSRTFVQRMIRDGQVRVNDQPTKPSYKIRPGDRIEVQVMAPIPVEITPEPIPLDVLYEDSHLLVLMKPPGLVVHPAPGHFSGTLVNALLHHCHDLAGIGGRERPGIVHRLDKDTSGVMVVAKSDAAHRGLARQFKDHTIERVYLALVYGNVKPAGGRIDLAIGRDRVDRKRISDRTTRPRAAVTQYQVLERFSAATLVAIRPHTGRTHQIRVHFASIRHPVLGDPVYGHRSGMTAEEMPVRRQMLHARTLGFVHPISCEAMRFDAPLPADMQSVLDHLRDSPGASAARARTSRTS